MSFGTPKYPSNTIVTQRWFTYIVGSVAKRLNVQAPRIKKTAKQAGVTWREFKAAICCMTDTVKFKRDDDSIITFGDVNSTLNCIWESTASLINSVCLLTLSFIPNAEIILELDGDVLTINPPTTTSLGISIIYMFVDAGENPPTVSILEDSGNITIALIQNGSDSTEPLTITSGGETGIIAACTISAPATITLNFNEETGLIDIT